MEQLFVSYDLAKELKDKGFDNPVIGWYFGKTDGICIMDCRQSPHFYKAIKAPLYQQAIDWFRDAHKISISIQPNFLNNKEIDGWEYSVYDLRLEKDSPTILCGIGEYYYSALNSAIEAALKSI